MSKTDYVVIDHHHDKEQGYYKVTVGIPYETEEIEIDSTGKPVQNEDQPVLAAVPQEDGTIVEAPLLGPDGQPMMGPGTYKLRKVVQYHSTEDFVFADTAKEWKGLSKEKIAEKQRSVVAEALYARSKQVEKDAASAAASRSSLPGAGEAL